MSGGSMVIPLPIYILNILVLTLGPLSVILIMSGLVNFYGLSRRPEFLVAAIICFLFPMLALPMAGIGILGNIKITEALPRRQNRDYKGESRKDRIIKVHIPNES